MVLRCRHSRPAPTGCLSAWGPRRRRCPSSVMTFSSRRGWWVAASRSLPLRAVARPWWRPMGPRRTRRMIASSTPRRPPRAKTASAIGCANPAVAASMRVSRSCGFRSRKTAWRCRSSATAGTRTCPSPGCRPCRAPVSTPTGWWRRWWCHPRCRLTRRPRRLSMLAVLRRRCARSLHRALRASGGCSSTRVRSRAAMSTSIWASTAM